MSNLQDIMNHKELDQMLCKIQVYTNNENQEIAAYMALNTNILDPLQKWNLVHIEKSGKSKIVSLTDDGKNTLKFLNS